MRRFDSAWVPPLAFLLYLIRYTYGFGTSDQDEFLPLLYHFLDPTTLASDWFTAGQAAEFGIRLPFAWMLLGISQVLSVKAAVFAVFAASWMGTAYAVQALSRELFRDRAAAAAAVVATLVVAPVWTLGGNRLVYPMLVPSMVAWALALWGVVLVLRSRTVAAAILFGVATWMQPLVGIHLAGLCGLTLLGSRRRTLVFGAVYGLAALPVLLPLFLQQTAGASPDLFYLLAEFRAPHHYLFFSFPITNTVQFGIVLAAGLGCWFAVRDRLHEEHRRFLRITGAGMLAGCVIAFVFGELVPVPFVTWLQFFKMTVLAHALLVMITCGAIAARLGRFLQWPFEFAPWAWGVTVALWIALPATGIVRLDAPRDADVAAVEEWAREHADKDAVFAIPPSWSGFRSGARRAVVVNFKAFPFRHGRNEEWFERLRSLAPITLPPRGDPTLQDSLDAAFQRLSTGALRGLARRYGADYAVRTEPPAGLDEVFRAGSWKVYRIDPEARTP